jgi:putative membrane protein
MKETDPLLLVALPDDNKSSLPTLYTLLREGAVLNNEGSTARDHLANERTFLAWIRTALSISGVGLGLLKWQGIANGAGYLVLSLGVLALLMSTVRYLKVMRQLSQRQFEPNVQGVLAVVAVILVVIVALLGLQTAHKL